MVNLQLGKIIAYANANTIWLRKAVDDFFPPGTDLDRLDKDVVSGLFNEWLIFDFHPNKSEATPLVQYSLKNPDHLAREQLNALLQVVATEHYSMYQIEGAHPGQWLDLVDITSAKKYRVYDVIGSSNATKVGCLAARLACIDHKWYIVGADPLYFPITYTKRALRIHEKNTEKLTPKMIFENTINKKDARDDMSDIDIPAKRTAIEREFVKQAKKYKVKTTFLELINYVYNEHFKSHFTQFYKNLVIKKGISEKVLFENTQLFQDIWNFFPHKILNDRCPHEIYVERLEKR